MVSCLGGSVAKTPPTLVPPALMVSAGCYLAGARQCRAPVFTGAEKTFCGHSGPGAIGSALPIVNRPADRAGNPGPRLCGNRRAGSVGRVAVMKIGLFAINYGTCA